MDFLKIPSFQVQLPVYKMGVLDKASKLIKEKKIELISISKDKIILEVGGHTVIRKKEAGRQTDSCDCQNHARYCKINPRCAHKDAATTFLVMRGISYED